MIQHVSIKTGRCTAYQPRPERALWWSDEGSTSRMGPSDADSKPCSVLNGSGHTDQPSQTGRALIPLGLIPLLASHVRRRLSREEMTEPIALSPQEK
ncbi:unnamed protein product [Protopolystoma xenopodis]|uniref:Uncharacterized protein n=1 Tax=Protopolystoma xenopodis TaxID=117903 RepID=A0A3S4ZTH7_9PLAT|nr:unnamed protein product [Protopolystoma xenopodis]